MIKKNLIILLLIPFLIALIGAAAVKTTYKMVENDIIDIVWKYDDTEGFQIDNTYELEASYIAQKNYEVSPGNELVWSIENKDKDDSEVHASISQNDKKFYLNTFTEGDCVITCSNKKGNVSKSMNAIIYEYGAIIINSEIKASQANLDNKIYYGQYDLVDNAKRKAEFNLSVKVLPEDYSDRLYVVETSSNLEFSLNDGKVYITNPGDSYITIGVTGDDEEPIKNQSYKYSVVQDGINVYTYQDLLYCTNKSTNGEIAVLRKSFESLANYNQLKETTNNVELFGTLNNNKFNFENEMYKFTTTYNHEFIDKWNYNCDHQTSSVDKLSDIVYAGLRIQKDFYGNGYTINMHNLTYPTGSATITTDDGIQIEIPVLLPDDLYRGALPFYSLGNPNNLPLVEAFGQDNSGMYLDGNNITLNDVNMKNCDFSNSLACLDYVGSVIDIHGENNTIINSRVSNGKNVIRAFSTQNLTIENSLLSNARNFLLYAGSNEYVKPNENKEYQFTLADGSKVTSTLSEFFKKDGLGDELLTSYASGTFSDPQAMVLALNSTQKALCDDSMLKDSSNNYIYKGKINVNDVYFYRSGVSSIGLDTMFDGAYLYASLPSLINSILGGLETQESHIPLSELLTTNTGGLSYPIELNINGKTRFYDYKEANNIDISGLINENINSFAQAAAAAIGHPEIDTSGIDINIDKIFPIKGMIIDSARNQGSIHEYDGKEYVNCVLAYYGGGYNYSKVTVAGSEVEPNLNRDITINLLNEYVRLDNSGGITTQVKHMMMKSVTITIGYHPFKFVGIKDNGYLFGETPNIKDLKKN